MPRKSKHVVQESADAPQVTADKPRQLTPDSPELMRGASPARDNRIRKKYKIPPSTRFKRTDPYYVVVRELTSGEIDEAAKVAATTAMGNRTSGQEMAKLSLDSICMSPDGASQWRTINHAEADHDVVWERLTNKIRVLITQACLKLNVSSDEEDASFFDSEEDG